MVVFAPAVGRVSGVEPGVGSRFASFPFWSSGNRSFPEVDQQPQSRNDLNPRPLAAGGFPVATRRSEAPTGHCSRNFLALASRISGMSAYVARESTKL